MAESDLITFNLQYETWRREGRIEELVGDRDFEYYCAEQFLKHAQLDKRELLSGQVDKSGDGGIDGFYCFFNGVLLGEDTEVDSRSVGEFDIKLFQSKAGAGFTYTAIDKINNVAADLFSFNKDEANYHYGYHDDLKRLIRKFKSVYNQLNAHSSPKLSLEVFYCTRIDLEEAEVNAARAAERLKSEIEAKSSFITVYPVHFIAARELVLQHRVAKPEVRDLPTKKNFGAGGGWVVLTTLNDYCKFLTHPQPGPDGNPQIDESLFDANVRGYNRDTKVNKRISNTLERGGHEFWPLNNGITIISPKTSTIKDNDDLPIHNPQIVNGLQTSRRIFEYYKKLGFKFPETDTRRLLIRVINTGDDEKVRSQIIRATNDQNAMPAEAFLSTMQIQFKIETYFAANSLFYDRRKGYYHSLQKPAHQIVDILELIQSTVAVALKQPNVARSSPRDYLEGNKRTQLFGSEREESEEGDAIKEPLPLDAYLRSVQIMRRVIQFLTALGQDKPTVKNLQSYVGLDAVTTVLGNAHYPSKWVAKVDVENHLTDELLTRSLERVMPIYEMRLPAERDIWAKSKLMADALKSQLKETYSPRKIKRETSSDAKEN